MRAIKFRGWDKRNQEMIFSGFVINVDGKIGTIINDHDWDLELIEFTGFYDNKEQEIYEGDVIKDDEGIIWKIIFSEGCFIAKAGRKVKILKMFMMMGHSCCEVIGNVFEGLKRS